MELYNIKIAGYRKFYGSTDIKVKGKMTAIVGRNEAGKSSVLEAIRHLGHNDPISDSDVSNIGKREDCSITGRYFLSDQELAEAQLSEPSWLIVSKPADGERSFAVSPPPPNRNIKHRSKLVADCKRAIEINGKFRAKFDAEDDTKNKDSVLVFLDFYDNQSDDLSEKNISELKNLQRLFSNLTDERDDNYILDIKDKIRSAIDLEQAANPKDFAIKSLQRKLPTIIFFDQAARNLKSNYTLEELGAIKIDDALTNLCDLAEIEINEILDALDTPDPSSSMRAVLNKANRNLSQKFDQDWGQSKIRVSLNFHNQSLDVQVENEDHSLTPFARRSDGLRQFVALQTFANANWKGAPILLIDEAEQKLHYDAQADLTQMLAKQDVAGKVIYTTHSAGCLPEDLGNGVRLVEESDDRTSSRIINQFWAGNKVGVTPLLFGMGAATMAFFPLRQAVFVEGASDMLLLPTMFREALKQRELGFQFVPGLAESEKKQMLPVISKEGSSAIYLLDSDPGGGALERNLKKHGVEDENIFKLEDDKNSNLELEDFIDKKILLEVYNIYLKKYFPDISPIKLSDITDDLRMHNLESRYKKSTKRKLQKTEIAYGILELIYQQPTLLILDRKRKKLFLDVANKVRNRSTSMSMTQS